jgi:hypothetical protein
MDRESWRVIYLPSSRDLTQATPPNGLSEVFIYNEKRVWPRLIQSVPSLERLGVDLRSVPDEAFDIEQELRSTATLFSSHRIAFNGR